MTDPLTTKEPCNHIELMRCTDDEWSCRGCFKRFRLPHEPLTVYGADPASEQRGEVDEAGNSAGTSSASVSKNRNQSDGPTISKLRNARLDWGMCCNCDCVTCRELDAAILAVVGTAPPPPDVQRDAERYRWLRDGWWLDPRADVTPDPMMSAETPEQFDAAIDAARAAEAKGGE